MLMRPLAVSELAGKADLIVEGRVLGKVSLRDDASRIYTKVQIQVSEVWKGSPPASSTSNLLTIVQGGGTVGDVREEVSGQVQYDLGEEVVAFLVINPRGEPVTIGLAQGKFHVWRDRQTGGKFANNLFHGEPEPDGGAASPLRHPLSLNEFKQQVQHHTP